MLRLKSLLKNELPSSALQKTADENFEYSLFVTKTCPNCKKAKSLLAKSGINYTEIAVEDEPQLALELDLRQAPSLVIKSQNGTKIVSGISNIKRYLEGK